MSRDSQLRGLWGLGAASGEAEPEGMPAQRREGSGRVEDGRGVSREAAPFPIPAHQTGRADFPHPAFRLASSQRCRRRAIMHSS